jgi:hypothetical protein
MTWEVIVTEKVKEWISSLDQSTRDSLGSAVGLLQELGPNLGRPYVGKIVGSKVKHLKELRPLSNANGHFRILFAFDPQRKAILLIAGDKTGQWKKWYKKHIPLAESLYEKYLESQ